MSFADIYQIFQRVLETPEQIQLVNSIFYSWLTVILKLDINFISWFPFFLIIMETISSVVTQPHMTGTLFIKDISLTWYKFSNPKMSSGRDAYISNECIYDRKDWQTWLQKHCQDLNIKTVLLLIYKEFVTVSKFKTSNVTKTQTSLSISALYLTKWSTFGTKKQKTQQPPSISLRLQWDSPLIYCG